jgi:hypothetical protein
MKPDDMIFYSVTALSAGAAAVVAMPEDAGDGCDGNESSGVFVSTPDGWVGAPPVPWPTVACLDTEEALVGVGLYGHLQHLPWAGGEIRRRLHRRAPSRARPIKTYPYLADTLLPQATRVLHTRHRSHR